MHEVDCQRSSSTVSLTAHEFIIMNNALNEVCNGVHELGDDNEFATRMGSTRAEVRALLGAVGGLLDRMKASPE